MTHRNVHNIFWHGTDWKSYPFGFVKIDKITKENNNAFAFSISTSDYDKIEAKVINKIRLCSDKSLYDDYKKLIIRVEQSKCYICKARTWITARNIIGAPFSYKKSLEDILKRC
jgi:hypothetical protein